MPNDDLTNTQYDTRYCLSKNKNYRSASIYMVCNSLFDITEKYIVIATILN